MLYAKITKRVDQEDSNIKAYVNVTVEDAAIMRGLKVVEGKNGLFVTFPAKQAYDAETKEPKVDEVGKPVYEDIIHPITAEAREELIKVVLEAYQSEKGYAYANSSKEKPTNQKIEAKMYARNGEQVKAAGTVTIGGMVCKDVIVALRKTKDGSCFPTVNMPCYEKQTEEGKDYVPYFEFLEKGKAWDAEKQETVEKDFKSLANGIIMKEAKEVNPEFKQTMDEISAARKNRKAR